MNRKEPNQVETEVYYWRGEVWRIQILDKLECLDEFMFDLVGKVLYQQSLPARHYQYKYK
jgi:hypothetical protein